MNGVMPKVRAMSGAKASVPFFAICKEIAPVPDAAEDHGDQGLGVGDFQYKYFGGNRMFMDEKRAFYEAMGNRMFAFKFKNPLWKFWAVFGEIKEGMAKLKEKGVEGNMRGIKGKHTMLQGGVIVVGPGYQGVLYVHREEGDPEGMPCDAIVTAVANMGV